jgi:hypothetical protein
MSFEEDRTLYSLRRDESIRLSVGPKERTIRWAAISPGYRRLKN